MSSVFPGCKIKFRKCQFLHMTALIRYKYFALTLAACNKYFNIDEKIAFVIIIATYWIWMSHDFFCIFFLRLGVSIE